MKPLIAAHHGDWTSSSSASMVASTTEQAATMPCRVRSGVLAQLAELAAEPDERVDR